jgi:hypothetical protein
LGQIHGQPYGIGSGIDHDEIVAEAVHLFKRDVPQIHDRCAVLCLWKTRLSLYKRRLTALQS